MGGGAPPHTVGVPSHPPSQPARPGATGQGPERTGNDRNDRESTNEQGAVITMTTTDLANLVLTDDVEQQNQAFIDAFNSGDGAIFDTLYRDDAISNLSGSPLTGAERRQGIIDLLNTGPKLDSKVVQNYVAGDVSLVIVEFRLDVADEQGGRQIITGTCTDVMRRTGDNRWIMAIDRPLADELPTK